MSILIYITWPNFDLFNIFSLTLPDVIHCILKIITKDKEAQGKTLTSSFWLSNQIFCQFYLVFCHRIRQTFISILPFHPENMAELNPLIFVYKFKYNYRYKYEHPPKNIFHYYGKKRCRSFALLFSYCC